MPEFVTAPTLETERLRLRAYRADDAEAHWAMLADVKVNRYLHGDPMGREDAWRRLLAAPGLWALLGFGYWAIERKEDGRFIGQVGFGDFHREMEPSLAGMAEIGWMLIGEVHGQGYASEAVAAALAWADEALPGREIAAIIAEGNTRSIRLAERQGLHLTDHSIHKGDRVVVFRR